MSKKMIIGDAKKFTDLWNSVEKQQLIASKKATSVMKISSSILTILIIITLVSSVTGHIPLSPLDESRDSNAKTGPSSKVNVFSDPSSSSSSSLSSSSSSSSLSSSSSSPHQSRDATVLYLPGGSEDEQSSRGKSPLYEFRIPSSPVVSPYYLALTTSGRSKNDPRTFSSSKSRLRYPVSYPASSVGTSGSAGRSFKSTPSCSTLKSLWKSGKLVPIDSIFAASATDDESSPKYRGEAIFGHIVTNHNQPERIDLPPGRFGDFAPDEQQISQVNDYGLDTNHVTVDLNSDSPSTRPIVKLSGRSDSYSDEGQSGNSLNNGGSSSSSGTSGGGDGSSSSSKAGGHLSASEFFNAVWHNGPVKF